MAFNLLSRFKRNNQPLLVPTALADGLTHGPGGTWAWVVLPNRATDEVNSSTLFHLTSAGADDLRRLIPSGAQFHFKVQWGLWSGQDYLDEELQPGMTDGGLDYLTLGANRIDEWAFPRRMVLLGARMDDDANPAAMTFSKLAGTSTITQDGTTSMAAVYKRAEAFIERMARSSFGARAATAQELAWSLRRDLRRTVDWVPQTSVITAGQIARLKSTNVTPAVNHVQIATATGVRFLRMVVPAEQGFPTSELELPGGEWLKHLNIALTDDETTTGDVAGPVEVSIRGRNVPQLEAIKICRDALALAKEQDREASAGMAGEVPDSVIESGLALRMRIKEISQGLLGMITDTPVWVVEAADLATLDRRTNAVIDFYGGMGITVWAPTSIQDLLWKELIIGDTQRVREFEQFRPWATLVGAWFHGGSQVGSETGPFKAANIGSTPGPFRNRLTDSQLARNAITTLFLGTTGSGKSTGVMLELLAELASRPCWAGLTDMKGDLGGIIAACELFGIPVTAVSTADRASGSMDPFRYVTDPREAASLVTDNLSMMLRTPTDDAEGFIRRAANNIAELADPRERSTYAVVESLASHTDPAVAAVGTTLRELGKDPLARSVTGEPDLTAPQLPTGPGLVYLRFEDLRWPGENATREDWKPGQRLSMMQLQAAFNYFTYMSSRIKGIPKLLALTELHLLTRYDFGRELVGSTARLGSALDTNLLLDTQSVGELLKIEGLADQVSQVRAFRVDSNAEADAQAILLGLEPEASMRNRQKTWGKGECMVRDTTGRVGGIRYDYLSAEIRRVLQTNPERTVTHLSVQLDKDTAAAATAGDADLIGATP